MAIVDSYAVNYTKKYVTVPPVLVHASYEGKTLTMMDTVETLASDVGATLYMFRPPKGARWNGMGFLATDALGAGRTCAVGIAGTTDKFLAATDHSAAARTELGKIATIASLMYEFDGATDVIVTTAGDAITGDETVTLMMQFVVA